MKTKDIRTTHKLKKQPCFVCGKYAEICQWHHILPLKDLKEPLSLDMIDLEISKNLLVCLCPNHHAIIHMFDKKNKKTQEITFWGNLDKEEKEKLIEILLLKTKKSLELGIGV